MALNEMSKGRNKKEIEKAQDWKEMNRKFGELKWHRTITKCPKVEMVYDEKSKDRINRESNVQCPKVEKA